MGSTVYEKGTLAELAIDATKRAASPQAPADDGAEAVLNRAEIIDLIESAISETTRSADTYMAAMIAADKILAAPLTRVAAAAPEGELRSAVDAVADFLEESANLSIISQFTAIQKWIDARSAACATFEEFAAKQRSWANRYDLDVLRFGWDAAMLAASPAAESKTLPRESEGAMTSGGKPASMYFRVGRNQGIQEALLACKREHLEEPARTADDIAYEQAVHDCERAIGRLIDRAPASGVVKGEADHG